MSRRNRIGRLSLPDPRKKVIEINQDEAKSHLYSQNQSSEPVRFSVLQQRLPRDPLDLREGLPAAEDDLGESAADRPVVVDLGELELLERRPPQLAEERVRPQAAAAVALEEPFQLPLVHGAQIVYRGARAV